MSQSTANLRDEEKAETDDGEASVTSSIESAQPKVAQPAEDEGDSGAALDQSDEKSDQSDNSDSDRDSDDESEISSVGEDDDVEAPNSLHANLLGVLSGRFPSQPLSPGAGASSGFPNMKGFVDSEAELSGSEASDDEQLGASADEYEEEYNSEEETLPTGEALKKELNKVHQKVAQADDNADLRTFKEMLLGDADYEEGMNSEGFFRTRRYRPALDETSQMDLFSPAGGDSGSDEGGDSQQEAARRKHRHDRNAFLHEKRLKEDDDHLLLQDEDSQSVLEVLDTNSNSGHMIHTSKKAPRLAKCGSFLSRSKATLKRLESQTSTALNLQGSTRGFVFKRTISNENSNPATPPLTRKPSLPKPAQVVRKAASIGFAPAAKRRSIFRDLVQLS